MNSAGESPGLIPAADSTSGESQNWCGSCAFQIHAWTKFTPGNLPCTVGKLIQSKADTTTGDNSFSGGLAVREDLHKGLLLNIREIQ